MHVNTLCQWEQLEGLMDHHSGQHSRPTSTFLLSNWVNQIRNVLMNNNLLLFCMVFIVTFFTLTGINFQQKVKGSEEFKGLARHWPVWIAPRVVINGWIAAFKIRNVLRFENGPLYAKRQTERENRLCCLNFTTDLFFMLI